MDHIDGSTENHVARLENDDHAAQMKRSSVTHREVRECDKNNECTVEFETRRRDRYAREAEHRRERG